MNRTEFLDWLCFEASGIVTDRDAGFALADYQRDEKGVTLDFEDGRTLRVSVE